MYKVRAVYDYSSPHEDDLDFKVGQIISVTEEEGDDWYVGEYIDDTGTKRDGLFPRNFVERYEPAPPPRPNRASRYKPTEQPAAPAAPVAAPTPDVPLQQEPEPVRHEEPEPPKAQPPPLDVPAAAKTVPLPMSPISPQSAVSGRAPELPQAPPPPSQQEAAKPAPAAKKPPPPIAAKTNAFRDRIAAFNAPAAAPIQPFKPAGAPANFIKKPFVAPPPSRNAYVPPVRERPPVKPYRRDEDPEIADRQAQDQEAAEKAGLVAHDAPAQPAAEEDNQPKVSLKERIALLQKQQQEQAERAAAMHKEKPKRPPVKKRTESFEGHPEDSEDTGLERMASGASKERISVDQARPPRVSHEVRAPDDQHQQREMLSDANDADQSAAGDTEDAEGESTSVEADDERNNARQPSLPMRAAAAPTQEPDVGDEQDGEPEEEEEEDEMDAETRRKLELRERMAKMSGGMGMPGMFGGIPMGGMPPPPPKKKKPTLDNKRADGEDEPTVPQQRVAMFPMPGLPNVKSPDQEDRQLQVEKEDETSHAITDAHPADEVPDVEDMQPQPVDRTPTGERPPPVPTEKRPLPPPVPSAARPAQPSVPQVLSPGPGSESGDEMTDGASALSPMTPSAQFASPSKRNSYFNSENQRQASMDRQAPPIPLATPSSPAVSRPPPPPPPTQAPPSRHGEEPLRKADRNEGETDYEGDYDTDIAPGATHKEALKSHARDASMDGSMTEEPSSARSTTAPHGIPPLPPHVPRAVPPPPPHPAPSRSSTDGPRGAPSLPPVRPPTRDHQNDEDDDDYDPYRYTGPPVATPPPMPRAVPPPPHGQLPPMHNRPPPPMPPSMPPAPRQQDVESDEDDLYSAPPARKSHDRPPPPPPQAPPHQHAPPPPPHQHAPPPPPRKFAPPLPPQERAAPPPPPGMGRKSLDANRALNNRPSMDQSRPAISSDFIARDIDLGMSSHWWTQPNMLPPSVQNRKDVLVDLQESQSGELVEKMVKILYLDYSQTTISARFDLSNVSDVELEQRNDPPPPRQRPDQLEAAYEQYGRAIAKAVETKQNTVVGAGNPFSLIEEVLKPLTDALPPVSTRAFGALVYANLANASTQSFDEIRPGDIITFRNAKFQGKTGPMHARYAVDVGKPDHVGVVVEWDGSKKKVRVWEQGREHKKVKQESFKMGDLRSGEVRVWRVVGRAWVGW